MAKEDTSMKQRQFLSCLVLVLFACAFARASNVPKEFEQKMKARYEHQKMAIVPNKVLVGVIQTIPTICPVNYDHFHDSVSIPKSYQRRNNLDERTTEEVESDSGRMETLQPGELLSVSALRIVRRSGFYGVDLFLMALSGTRQDAYGKALGVRAIEQKKYGVHFRFAFAPEIIERGDYDTVVAEINKYLLPPEEYKQAGEAQTKVEIQPGMSQGDVIKALGEPLKTIAFGKKTILKYQDLTIELEEDKVVDVKAN
jgi:hypothetical protein